MPRIKKPSFRKKGSAPSSSLFSFRTKLLLTVGLIFILIPLIFYINQTIQLMYFVPNIPETPKSRQISSPPIQVSIPSLSISLPVLEMSITNNTWGVSNLGASHLKESANPTEGGPIIIYGHNTNDRFGPIRWLNKNDSIIITTENKKTYTYRVVETRIVDPDELSVFFQRKNEALYLFTCDGFADLKRYIVIAEPDKDASPSAAPQ